MVPTGGLTGRRPDYNIKRLLCNTWKQRNGRLTVGDVYIWSRNGAPSRKGGVVNGQMIKPSNK